jgi:protein ImuB
MLLSSTSTPAEMPRAGRSRMLTVWWAHWPVVAAGIAGEVAIDHPAIVIRANRVVACSPAAATSGVSVGLRRRVAQQRCPEAALLDHQPDRDARVFEAVVGAVNELTPRLEVVEPGWLCVEARGPSRYFGGDERLGARLVAVIGEVVGSGDLTGLGIGVADGRFASAVAARLAVDAPARTMVIRPGSSAAFLASQPVAWLQETGEVDADLVSLFARLGLSTLGSVAELTGADVADRFGPPGALAHRLATGNDDRPSLATEPAQHRHAERVFDEPVEQLQPLAFVGKQLADQLTAELALSGLVCTRLVVTAESDHGERSERVWFRARGLSAEAMVERIRWQLDGWIAKPGALSAGIVLLRLDADEVRHDGGDQLRLWGGVSAADERAVRTIARLTGIAGEESVRVPAWQGGRLPGDRYRWVPAATTDLTDPDDTASRLRPDTTNVGPWPGALPAPSPAVVVGADGDDVPAVVADEHGHPVVVGGRGELSAQPATLTIDSGPPLPIIRWAGPWPLDERWWDTHRRRRVARFQVVTADGAAHLVVVERRQWRVLASYS